MSQSWNDTAGEDAGIAGLTASDHYRLFAAERRRHTIDILTGYTAPIALEELAAEIAAREVGADHIDQGTVERVTIALCHTHLPMLDEKGCVAFDQQERAIGKGPNWEEMATLLQQFRDCADEVATN